MFSDMFDIDIILRKLYVKLFNDSRVNYFVGYLN